MKKILAISVIISSVIFITCLKRKTPVPVGLCDPNTVYFTKDVQPILTSNCAMSGCHNAKSFVGGYNFADYYGTMKAVSAGNPSQSTLYTIIQPTGRRIMPPGGYPQLNSTQIATINNWILQGAKNEICTESATCDTSNVTYGTTVSSIVSNNCIGCHSSSNQSGGVDLSSFAGVASQAANGKLMGTTNNTVGFNPMPPSGAQLSSCDRQKIQHWIDSGTKNN